MASINLNLLPTELKVSTGLSRSLRSIRMLGVIGLVGFLVFGLGLIGFFVFSSFQLSNLNSQNDTLKGQLTTLSTSETQLVLLKDRIAKIKIVQGLPTSDKNLTNFRKYISGLSGSSTVNELDVDPGKITAAIDFRSNSDLTTFLTSLSENTEFKVIDLSSFGFNPATGYLVSLTVTPK